MKTFGLIGKKLEHSFSSKYFSEKFIKEGITNTEYLNFEIKDIVEFKKLVSKVKLAGLNVTIPYKQTIIPFLDELNDNAKIIGASEKLKPLIGTECIQSVRYFEDTIFGLQKCNIPEKLNNLLRE